MEPPAVDPDAFKTFEHDGWVEVAAHYHRSFQALTSQAVESLLDGAAVRQGQRVLDVASGPGYVAAAAARRGAQVVGVDFSATMVEQARRLHPGLEFQEGDAEALPFEEQSFDAVVINFGVLHFARPDQALAEAHRVLRDGGRLALTAWADPEIAVAFGIVSRAIEAHGSTEVGLPAGPPFFRFGDPDESRRALREVGFADPEAKRLPLVWRLASSDDLFAAFWEGGVRTRGVLRGQTPEALERIRAAIRAEVLAHAKGGAFELPAPAVLASARRV